MLFRFLRASPALLVLALPLACGGSTISANGADASTDGGGSFDDASLDVSPTCSRSTQLCKGICVDTMNDSANCGACGHSCGASPCVMSNCQPTGLPPDPGGPPGDGAGSTVFAFSKIYVGDTDRLGTPSQTAWKNYGLDLDGLATDKTSTNVCTLAAGASKSTQTDGPGGIDNSWGLNILPIWLTTAGQDFGTKINLAINAGTFTNLMRIDRLGPQASYSPLGGAFFGGTSLGSTPTWNGSDMWPVDARTVNGTIAMPKAVFSGGYMNNRVWVSGTASARITLPIAFSDIEIDLPLDHAVLTMLVDPNNQSATNGVLAAVVPTEEFIVVFKNVAGRISSSLCQGSAFDSIAQQIRQASDILLDGTNRAGTPCSAISLGVGFDAKRVQLGSVVTPATTPNPCP